jgi:Abnormal spindle-like microcephaly-assoc'd, ASPM-SPD-2-Hydin
MTHLHRGGHTLLVLLALGMLLGCQGLSSSKQAVSPSSNNQPAELTTSTASISFGNVEIGKNQTQALTLTNSGGSSLSIVQVTPSGTGFTASESDLPLVLTAGQSKALSVMFTPQYSGSSKGNLTIANNGSTPTVTVALSGTGMPVGPAPQGTLTPNPTSLDFGSVPSGQHLTISEILTNTGTASLYVTQTIVTGSQFSVSGIHLPLTLAVNQSTSFNVTFAPKSTGDSTGNLAITSNGSTSTVNLALAGSGTSTGPNPQGTLAVSPLSLNFGSVQPGKKLTLNESLSNTGSAELTVSRATLAGSGFSLTNLALPLVLKPGQSFSFQATFAPRSVGNDNGTLSLVSNGSDPRLTIPLTGGAPNSQLTIVPTSINLGTVTVGSKAQQTSQLAASGASVTVSSVKVNSSEFTITGITFPVTIPAGQSVSFTATFTPRAPGQTSGTASFASDASDSPTVESLAGTGAAAPQYNVNLAWNPSSNASSAKVVGYNVYRGTQHGGPYTAKVASLDPQTTYRDSTVVSGQTYYYVVTAVNAKHKESSDSNEVKVVVP